MAAVSHKISRDGRTVTVTIPHEVGFDLRKIQEIQAALVARLGHPGCYSGRDILFQQEVEFSVDAKTLELRSVLG